MFDNGLLKYYEQRVYKGGILQANDIALREIKKLTPKVRFCSSIVGEFYKRYNGDKVTDKRVTDSQVLLSQIYNKVGLQSAVYLPATQGGRNFLLSNNVQNSSSIELACDYIEHIPKYQYRFPFDFLNPEGQGESAEKFFTDWALSQQTKMRIYDVASFNNDRHYANFFYQVQNGVVEDVVAIDFEVASNVYDSRRVKADSYFSDFSTSTMPRQEVLTNLEVSETLPLYIDKQEVAEELGSINPTQVAQEIYQTIGYQVDAKLTDALSRGYEEVAEILMN